MADRELERDGCLHCACGAIDKLLCDHRLCIECCCKLDSLTLLCPGCVTHASDNVDILSDPEVVVSDRELAMEMSDKEEMDITQLECVHTNLYEVECEKEIMEDDETELDNVEICDPKITLCQRITEALVSANDSFQQLDAALQTLSRLEHKIKQDEDKVIEVVKQEFKKLAFHLNTRKCNLIAEVRKCGDMFAVDIAKAAENILQKRACLEARLTIAKTVLKAPSESVYCNLDQLVELLKEKVENDCLVSDSLKKGLNVRILFNHDTVQGFETIGKVCRDQVEINEANTSNVDLSIDKYASEHYVEVSEHRRGSNRGQAEVEWELEEKPAQFKENTVCFKKLNLPTSQDAVAVFPQSLCDPDVIIEEIIDDDDIDRACSDLINVVTLQTNRTEVLSNRTHLNKVSTWVQNRPKLLKNARIKPPMKKDCQENVQLTHVINPCHFYVHRISQKKHLIMLERMLKALGQTPGSCSQSDTLVIGEIIICYSTKLNLWCRGRITELIPLERKYKGTIFPPRYKIEDILQMKVFLIDYGSCEIFRISRITGSHLAKNEPVFHLNADDFCHALKKIDQNSHLGQTPPFAILCSLMDIVPQNSEQHWSMEATEEMKKMIKKKFVTMKVFRMEENKLIVDLRKPSTNPASSDTPASLRDALVFLGLARIGFQVLSPEISFNSLEFPKPVLPEEATQVDVLVCHMNDPSDFFIHVLSCSQYLNIVRKIQEIYNSEESGDFDIFSPEVGQPCIAQYEDEDWYRAEVVGHPNHHEVEIRFVDFGNITRVNIKKLRRITEEFLRFPCQAICCRLSNIQPSNNAPQWSLDACDEFEKMVTDKRLRCVAIGVLMDDKLAVELYEDETNNLTSINTILVKKDVASFICCDQMLLNQCTTLREVWDHPTDMLPDPLEDRMNIMALLEYKELVVLVSHVVSPSSLFVQWKTSENFMKSFQETLNNRYENTQPENTEWHVDMYVAAKLSSIKQWRRGIIENVLEKSVEVFLYDFGNKEVIDVINIRTLDESHKLHGGFCLECSLMDIKPSGGCTEWTKTACEVLSYYLKGAEVKMVIEENTSKWPLPVKMTSMDEVGQQVDISSFLVRQGLALKERRQESETLMEVNESLPAVTAEDYYSNKVETGCDVETDQASLASLQITKSSSIEESAEPATKPNLNEPYLPPIMPDSKIFRAKVTHVTENGVIYVIHESLENDLGNLMSDVQQYLKGPGLLMPYSWKKGEGCLVKGSDNTSYRGKVLEIVGGDMIKVQYEDFGYTETILKCHLHPYSFRPNIPRFCIPCQLCNVLPVGEKWQPDAIALLKELLLNRHVRVHLEEPPKCPGDTASVYLYCDDASVASILELHAHCSIVDHEKTKEQNDLHESTLKKAGYRESTKNCFRASDLKDIFDITFESLLLSDPETASLTGYSSSSLPHPGELFPVTITHLETPNIVFIMHKDSDYENTFDETLASCLEKINLGNEELKPLTDFKLEVPCLARYHDGKLYRAKLKSIQTYDSVRLVVQFVDYGSNAIVQTDSIFQIPTHLLEYPARAVKVKMAGFKPPVKDFETVRIPYCPAWSMNALYKMMELIEGNTQLFASCTATSQEVTVFIYDNDQQLLHKQLVSMGFADYC